MDSGRTLGKVLLKSDIDKIPADVLKKLEKFCKSRTDELTSVQVLYNAKYNEYEKLRKDFDKISSNTERTGDTNMNPAKAIEELRRQLDGANSEIKRLADQVMQHELETISYRNERNDIMDERDQLQSSLDRNNASLQRLQSDIKILETKLESASSEKCNALAELAEMVTEEQSLVCKQMLMEREKELLNNEIAILTEKLKDVTTELLSLRQENTSDAGQLKVELKQKTEDLFDANTMVCQLTETNQLLTNQSEQNTLKLKEQVEESVRLVDHYRKELDAKIKLADLYKESSDDYQGQVNKQASVIADLKRQLDESTNQGRALERKLNDVEAQHQIEMGAKDELVKHLEQELKLLETDAPETILEKLAPSAAAANRLLKGNLSLTEIYTRYHKAIENFNSKDYEFEQLKLKLEHVQSEINRKTTEFEMQTVEYRKLLTVNKELTQKVNKLIVEQDRHQEELKEIRSKFGYLEREDAKLKATLKDLARQICYLLNEIQAAEAEVKSDQEPSGIPNNLAIAKKLVTFKNIEEMQYNNQKLLLKVRELSSKVEKMEDIQNHINMQCYDEKISSYEKQLHDAEQLQQADKELLAMCIKQKERFKQLYYDAMKDFCKTTSVMEGIEDDTTVMSGPNVSKNVQMDGQDNRATEIEKELQDKIKELTELKEEYNDYRTENTGNFKLLNDQFEAMQNKVKESISSNCQLSTQVNFANEKIKIQERDMVIYKRQIQTLEERNRMYDKIIGKHELSIKHFRDEALNAMKKLSAAENQCEYLQEECRRLIDKNSSLEREHQAFHRQNLTHNILQSNLEMMKVSSERLQFEGRLQMEQQLDKITRECSTLRQKLQDEQNRFREDTTTFKRQADSAIKKMKDEQAQAEMLRSKIKEERRQIESKNQQINDLSKKLQEALTPCKFDNPIAKGNKKIKDLELQMKNKAAEIEKLKNDLGDQVAVLENKWKAECDKFKTCKAKLISDLQASQLNETNLKSQVEELQSEIRLQITGSHLKAADAVAHSKVQNELKEALQKNSENNRELRDLCAECHKLKMSFETIELKYSNEMQLHSSDLQALTLCKDELNKCREQIDQLRCAKDKAKELLKTKQLEFEIFNKQANGNQLKFEESIVNLTDQNTALHNLLQAHNTKASTANDVEMNDSIGDSSILSRTLTDDEINEISSEKLFSVVKYLRREKDIAVTKIEILKAENTRLSNEYEIQEKHLNELIQQRTADKSPVNEANVVSASKYDDLMRKVDTLNAITDSNIRLRDERDALLINIGDLTERLKKVEDEFIPLQEINLVLTAKTEEQTQIINKLQSKDEARILEMAEESKRLQNKRDYTAKILITKSIRLNEEVNLLKSEKIRLEQDLAATYKKLNTTIDEKKEIQNEFNNLKLTNLRLTVEITEVKGNISKKEIEVKVIQDKLSSTDAELVNTKNKEIQIRQIAKQYKDSYFELKAKADDCKAELATKPLEEQIEASTKIIAASAHVKTKTAETKKKDDLRSQLQLALCQTQIQKKNESLKEQVNRKEFLKEMTSQYEPSSSNKVTTTQSRKRPRDVEVNSAEEASSASESTTTQNKRTRLSGQKFQGGMVHGLDIEYQLPTSSQRDEHDDVMDVKIEDIDDAIENEATADEATADEATANEAFDAEIDSRDESELFENIEKQENDVSNEINETISLVIPGILSANRASVHTSDSATENNNHPNQSSIGPRANVSKGIELLPPSLETQQKQKISSGSDADQENISRQVQPQRNSAIQQAYEEVSDEGIVPSTPTFKIACRSDGKAVSSPYLNLKRVFEGMGESRSCIKIFEESGDGVRNSIETANDSDHQHGNKETDEKELVGGISGEAVITDAENAHTTFNDSGASILQVNDQNISVEMDADDEIDVGIDTVSYGLSKQEEIQVGEDREAVAKIQTSTVDPQLGIRRSGRIRRIPPVVENKDTVLCNEELHDQQMSSQHHGSQRKKLRRTRR